MDSESSASSALCAIPRHVAIIMDGNRRWAKRRLLPIKAGHRAGGEAIRATLRAALDLKLEVLTLYAFSSENWKRSEAEIADLMDMVGEYFRAHIDELVERGVRLQLIGNWRSMRRDVVEWFEEAQHRTADNQRGVLVFALNYGAHDEIARAARAVAETQGASALTPAAIESALDTCGLPPLDLLIRTSGEVRLSNFLLWQAGYAELYFTETLWPDFGKADLEAAIAEYSRRERRYGADG